MAVINYRVIKNLSTSEYVTPTGSSLNIADAQTFTSLQTADTYIATAPDGYYESLWVSQKTT
tara:strand:- start:118 stop:303 length:186 start_codon:yes stop_codon:yes gene_type:complete